VWILVDVVDARGVEHGRAALDAMNLITFGKQKCGEVCPILPGDSCDQRFLQTSISFASSAQQLKRALRSACVGFVQDAADC
jgi:hypothetical protein